MKKSETASLQLQFDTEQITNAITEATAADAICNFTEQICICVSQTLPKMLTCAEQTRSVVNNIQASVSDITIALNSLGVFLQESLTAPDWLGNVDSMVSIASSMLSMGDSIVRQFADPTSGMGENGGLLQLLLPAFNTTAETVAGWFSDKFLKALCKELGIIAADLGAWFLPAVLAILVVIVAVITLIATTIYVYWDEISAFLAEVPQWFESNIAQPIQNAFSSAMTWFSELFGGLLQAAWDCIYNLGVTLGGIVQLIFRMLSILFNFLYNAVIEPAGRIIVWFLSGTVTSVDGFLREIAKQVAPFVTFFQNEIVSELKTAFYALCDSLPGQLGDAVEAMMRVLLDFLSFWLRFCGTVWSDLVALFSTDGLSFQEMAIGVTQIFRNMLNQIIAALNTVIAIPFGGLNTIISSIRNAEILGIQPFSKLRNITVPQIPYLAKGAVLPANKPFLAMVGDQKHGTNIEAPLATIQDAVALVMNDQAAAMMAGFEAVVRAINEKNATLELDGQSSFTCILKKPGRPKITVKEYAPDPWLSGKSPQQHSLMSIPHE